jgi:small conductance mechanosensitive channel
VIWGQVIDPSNIATDLDSVTVWDFVWAAVIVAGSFLVAAAVRRIARRLLSSFARIPESYVLLIARATGWLVIVLGIIYALDVLGVDLGPALIVLLIVGGSVVLAGRGLLENFGAGLILQGTPMFDIGDQIETTSGSGTVHEVTGRTVILRSPDGEEINVPNVLLVNDAVTNMTKLGRRRSTIPIGVAYGSDYETARTVIAEAATFSDLALADPAPQAVLTEFGDDAVIIELLFWHDPTVIGEKQAIDQVARRVAADLAANGIEIAFPQRVLWWGEGRAGQARGAGDDG